jgi:DNA-binding protein HU-beta
MNKAELIDGVAEGAGLSKKDATAAVDAVFDSIYRAVAKGEKVSLTGFGIFEKSDRPARTGRNPQTGASVQIAATSVPKFRAGAEFKIRVNADSVEYPETEGWRTLSFPLRSISSVPSNQPGVIAYSWLGRSDHSLVADLQSALNRMSKDAGVFDYARGVFGNFKVYYRPVFDTETLRELDGAGHGYNASRAGRPYKFTDFDEIVLNCPTGWGIYRIKRIDKTAYVGLATNIRARLLTHIRSENLSFTRGDFVEVILAERSNASKLILWDNLAEAERVHIQKTKNDGYTLDNTTSGGNGRTPNYGFNN